MGEKYLPDHIPGAKVTTIISVTHWVIMGYMVKLFGEINDVKNKLEPEQHVFWNGHYLVLPVRRETPTNGEMIE